MIKNAVFIFIFQLIIIYLIAIILYFLMLLNRKIKIYDRLNKYTVYKKVLETKFFDDFFLVFDKIVKVVSILLKKIKIFNKYSLKYQKYIKKEDKDKIDKMDFVSKKVILSFLYLFIVIIYDIFKYQEITFFQVIFSLLIGFYSLDLFLISINSFLKKEKENDLLKAITIMNNSFKSGRSIMQSIKLVADELDSPLGLEFQKMYIDLTYGLSLDVVFKRFENRVNLEEVKYITTSLAILNNTGGDIVKVFESVEKTFFNDKKLKDELKNLTSASKMLYYILIFIPIVFVLVIYILDNSYFKPFFTTSLGYFILILCLLLYISYILVIKRIMKIGDIL